MWSVIILNAIMLTVDLDFYARSCIMLSAGTLIIIYAECPFCIVILNFAMLSVDFILLNSVIIRIVV